MLATASKCLDLEGSTEEWEVDVLDGMSRVTMEVACLIDKYAKMSYSAGEQVQRILSSFFFFRFVASFLSLGADICTPEQISSQMSTDMARCTLRIDELMTKLNTRIAVVSNAGIPNCITARSSDVTSTVVDKEVEGELEGGKTRMERDLQCLVIRPFPCVPGEGSQVVVGPPQSAEEPGKDESGSVQVIQTQYLPEEPKTPLDEAETDGGALRSPGRVKGRHHRRPNRRRAT